jgi:hypothetical protein
MLGLPGACELHEPLPKSAIFMKFDLEAAEKAQFDADIYQLAIVGEVSPATTNIAASEQTKAFYAIQVSLRNMNYEEANIALPPV